MRLILLQPDEVAGYESRLRPLLEKPGAKPSSRYSANETFDLAKRNIWQLWVGEENGDVLYVGGTELTVYPSGMKSLLIKFVAGHRRDLWQHHIDTVLDWGKLQGCSLAEGVFRKGWKRILPGWTHSYDYLERQL